MGRAAHLPGQTVLELRRELLDLLEGIRVLVAVLLEQARALLVPELTEELVEPAGTRG